ncbi:roadblock/LC7 domain-containing protein [candidate division KSB1 bacterium]|nr:roadblock/LC7 domain-containing protein [candidate division KSB1 bacterium]
MDLENRKNGKRLVFSEDSFQRIIQILDEFLNRSQARLAIFADLNGYPVVYRGEADTMDISSLTALAAGDFAATAEMANLISEESHFRFLYHEGVSRCSYLCSVGNEYFILIVFEKKVALGVIRVLAHYAVEKILQLIQTLKKQSEETKKFLDFEFRDILTQRLDESIRAR